MPNNPKAKDNLKPFKIGHKFGKGRGKGNLNRSTYFKQWNDMIENKKNPITGDIQKLNQTDFVILAILNKARKGDVAAAKEWLDAIFGKNTDNVDMTTQGEKIQNEIVILKLPNNGRYPES